jgi:hypothetical protein
MTRRRCPHCSSALEPLATTCASCGKSFRATECSAEDKAKLFAEIEQLADESGWTELPGTRRQRVINEGWIIVPLALGFAVSVASQYGSGITGSLPEFRDWIADRGLDDLHAGKIAAVLAVVAAVIGWFIAQHRATEVEVEEILVDYHPAIAVEKSLVRYFPLLPKRPTVVLELEGGEQIAYGAERRCYERVVSGQPGLALIASNRLLHFLTLDDA